MNNFDIYRQVSIAASKITTKKYSTSFSLGISLLNKRYQLPIYAIYGFVRVADEIVDTFHDYDKAQLFKDFRIDTYKALNQKISTNPILQSFQEVVNCYKIDIELIDTFLDSMEMDLSRANYDDEKYKQYIVGSAEVVGLMCLRVFTDGYDEKYEELKPYAMKLGSAFQKVNFLRDFSHDFNILGRTYFPGVDFERLDDVGLKIILNDIEKDFKEAFVGIRKLNPDSRLGVYLAYIYYISLFKKIKRMSIEKIKSKRVRVADFTKYSMLGLAYLRAKCNML